MAKVAEGLAEGVAEKVGEVVLVRHGETDWSASGRHTGRTDIPLTGIGVAQAEAVAPLLAGHRFSLVLTSPLQRAAETARLAGLEATIEPGLAEWDYGEYEGRTTPDICADRPDWNLWYDGCPGGESPDDVGRRADRVIDRIRAALTDGDVCCVSHGHLLRTLTARWLGLEPAAGGLFGLDTATVSVLGREHSRPVIRRWNLDPGGAEL